MLGVKAFIASEEAPTPPPSSSNSDTETDDTRNTRSKRIYGRFQRLKYIKSERLCQYVEIVRSRHDRLYCISEHYERNLRKEIDSSLKTLRETNIEAYEERVQSLLFQTLQGVHHLHSQDPPIIHRNLVPENILIDSEGAVKLADYGFYYMTGNGEDVSFPIGWPSAMAPETIVVANSSARSTTKVDIWSVGLVLLQLLGETLPWITNVRVHPELSLSRLVGLCSDSTEWLFTRPHLSSLPSDLITIARECLRSDPGQRPTAETLLGHPMFYRQHMAVANSSQKLTWVKKPHLKCMSAPIPTAALTSHFTQTKSGGYTFSLPESPEPNTSKLASPSSTPINNDPLRNKPLSELFLYWKLAGGNLEEVVAAAGAAAVLPSVRRLPRILRTSLPENLRAPGAELAARKQAKAMEVGYDGVIVPIRLAALRRLLKQSKNTSIVLSEEEEVGVTRRVPVFGPWEPQCAEAVASRNALPSVEVRERDLHFQRTRCAVFREILDELPSPSAAARLKKEALVDVPPSMRAEVWVALLRTRASEQNVFTAFDDNTVTVSDDQISRDVPRCHPYHELLSSPAGRTLLQKLLRVWVHHNPSLLYWQGMDSVAAQFVILFFSNAPLAFACVQRFVDLFLSNLFRKESSFTVHHQLAAFTRLLLFCDPKLAVHMDQIGYTADLYAVSWFLTLFAHVLPLDKVALVWDALLLTGDQFVLFFAVGVLQQLRSMLLSTDFEGCVTCFAHLPGIDIAKCISWALEMITHTPPSLRMSLSAEPPYTAGWDEESRLPAVCRVHYTDLAPFLLSIAVVDVRSSELFKDSHINGSLSAPSSLSITPAFVARLAAVQARNCLREGSTASVGDRLEGDGDRLEGEVGHLRPQQKGDDARSLVVVAGDDDSTANMVACKLVLAGVSGVCVLEDPLDADLLHRVLDPA